MMHGMYEKMDKEAYKEMDEKSYEKMDEKSHEEPKAADMIKTILQKIIDEMNMLESDRIMPENRRPKAVQIEIEADVHKPDELGDDTEELNPVVLDELMAKADEADETGALPEDAGDDLPPEIAEAVYRKKKLNKPV